MGIAWSTAAGAGLALAIGLAGWAVAQTAPKTNELVVVSWGGSYQEAQRKAYFEPFARATGVRVVEGTGPQIDRSRAEVQSGRPSYDLTATNQAFNLIGVEQNLWLPIDYSHFDPEDLKAMPQEVRLSHGVGTIYYAEGLALSTRAFAPGATRPRSWADVWDVTRFAGKRALPWCDVATYPLPEAALLADGVPVDKLYPIDMPRAAAKLKALSPNVIWWRDINQAGQLLTSGEATMAMAPSGRIQTLIDQGAPLEIVWDQARYTFDVWYVLRGAANADNAMRFIAFASKPEQQAAMARIGGYGPTNPRALALLDEATVRKLANAPQNFARQFRKDEAWWKDNRARWVETCTAALL